MLFSCILFFLKFILKDCLLYNVSRISTFFCVIDPLIQLCLLVIQLFDCEESHERFENVF